uniref:Dynein heavy chain n=1 Tax=Micromonas pusilla TaxID=38833 RepID=A0A7S0PMT4_MICPS
MARKLVQTYRLCSEQLSSQDHYDYGMRAVIAVLRAAGNLKRKFVDEAEDVLMLRALTDVNLPKFLDQDVPLFRGILSDLFPGVKLPEIDYDNLNDALRNASAKAKLQPLDTFFEKIIQLYEMIIVRHGLMLVGESYGMKSSCISVLADALGELNDKGLNGEQKVKYYCLNPKSITMGQLYGAEDPVSKEWADGILAVTFRNAARDTSPDRKWVVFDGPVDAIWIENMNTVLDDNKKLCLNSGEIVAMQGLMNMIFEVQDLAVASPATVSRCGMVYVQPSLLGWRPVMVSWLDTLPAGVTEAHKEQITALFDWLVPPCLRVATKICKMPQPMQEINLAQSLMRLFDSLLDEFKEPANIESMKEALVSVWIDSLFLFSLVWSIGASVDEEGRAKFDSYLRRLMFNDVPEELTMWMTPGLKGQGKIKCKPFPSGTEAAPETVYDFCFDKPSGTWKRWVDLKEDMPIGEDEAYSSIIVPTVDTIRYTFLIDTLVTHGKNFLFVGPTGTGKTAYIKRHVASGIDSELYSYTFMNFSAQTSANMTQDIVDGKLDKRKKGTFGPPPGKKMIVFVDDLNMPQVEEYGAQPPIELLRQFMDYSGWYDRRELTFRNLVDMQFIAAMGPPGGGRNNVTNRYLRHYHVICATPFNAATLTKIFSTLVEWWMRTKGLPEELHECQSSLVKGTIELYQTVQRELLPTPMKSHYTFNLRDLSKVLQGMLLITPDKCKALDVMTRLWVHESMRVFHDRLISVEDKDYYKVMASELVEKNFAVVLEGKYEDPPVPEGETPPEPEVDEDGNPVEYKLGTRAYKDLFEDRNIIFGDFLDQNCEPEERVYEEGDDIPKMIKIMEDYLEEYNFSATNQMNLVFFMDAAEHATRIARILRQPRGNAMLVGVGGSGKQSLTRFGSFMAGFKCFSIELTRGYGITEFRDDLKNLYVQTGIEGTPTVFLFTDTQIVTEGFVEDINNILNSGEVPNLFPYDERAAVMEQCRVRAKKAGQILESAEELWHYFIASCKANLHIILCFSPIGEAFRERLRQFPSLVNCCTIDWFREWPNDALEAVAFKILADVDVPAEERQKLLVMCKSFHKGVGELSEEYLAKEGRHNYVTPTSYLELLNMFTSLLAKQREAVSGAKRRYEVGLEKLAFTADAVRDMQDELTALKPNLIKTVAETEELMEKVQREKVEVVEPKKAAVDEEVAEAAKKGEAAGAVKKECEDLLAEAIPALEAAVAALDTITDKDIKYVNSFKSPPAMIKLVLESVCVALAVKPAKVPDPAGTGKMIEDYWPPSKKLLMDPTFIDQLRGYDKDNIDPVIMEKLRTRYIADETYTIEKAENAAAAAAGLCKWVFAMDSYDRVAKIVAPKQLALAEAEAEYQKIMDALKEKQDNLADIMGKLAAMEQQLEDSVNEKKRLEDEVDLCTVKLERAESLIGGLGGEGERWKESAAKLGIAYENLTGDMLIAAGMISYLGTFTMAFRDGIADSWVSMCKESGIPSSPKFSLQDVLGDPVAIRKWGIAGLPNDSFSIDNGIMIANARRWPLMIDPQGQANKWIKNMCKESGIDVIKLSNKDYLRTLANAIRFGRAVLLENIGEQLDAALEPLLQKQTFKQGGSEVIKMGDDIIPYHPDFRFYMTTKMRNPHYQPEVSVKVSLLNFFVTLDGLEDQLLGTVVMQERRDLAEAKNQLVVSNARMKAQLKDLEDKILYMLSNSTGNILDDEELINTLAQSKVTSDDITEKVAEAEVTERDIDQTREKYRPVATRASVLFFCISDLAIVDPMYQYSLAWFISLFIRGIEEADKPEEMEDEEARAKLPADDVEARIEILNEYFTYSLYNNICRSLFERHKLMFSLLLCVAIMQQRGEIDAQEWRFLLAGPTDTNISAKNPAPEWVTEKVWIEVVNASNLPAFAGFSDAFAASVNHYRKYFESGEAHRFPLDDTFDGKLNEFQKLLVIRCIRPDRFMLGVTDFVSAKLGSRFIEPPPFDLEACYAESRVDAPLIFVLSSGADPMADLLKLCEEKEMLQRFDQVSLGQGQGPKAEAMIERAMEEGMWVCLQNCHLAESWMPKLDVICETIDAEAVHPDFRLWLSAMPSPAFPVAILQNGIKMTLEPPKGLKANLIRSYTRITDEYMDECKDPASHKRLLFSICLFHAVIQDRRKFGPLGWNIRYDFTDGDLNMCQRQIKMMIDDYEEIPYKVIRVLCGEINYGGRVTDDKDRRLMNNLLNNYIIPEVLTDDFTFSPSPTYPSPKAQNVEEFVEFIKSLPLIPQPEIFGLHENADITCDQNETYSMFETVLSLQPRVAAGGGLSREEVIGAAARDIFDRCPSPFDIDAVGAKYPTDYNQSMNTVLTQECIRYNNLIVVMRRTLQESLKALKGLVVMTDELEAVTDSIFDNQVPDAWASKAYPSLKPLSSWVLDLLERIKFIDGWIDNGPPPVYWISGLFFPQAFLTGTLQNYARKNGFAIDSIQWNFVVQDTKTYENTKQPPENGCYITGFFLEGARWDYDTHLLTESRPKELYTDFPLMWLEPCKDRVAPTTGVYNCPAYKTLTRAGVLSTTGHSTNFVMYLEVPTDKSESHWINSSVALFTALMF